MNIPLWFLVGMVVINLISIGIFFALLKNLKHVTTGQIKIIGHENKKLILNNQLFVFKIAYILAILILSLA